MKLRFGQTVPPGIPLLLQVGQISQASGRMEGHRLIIRQEARMMKQDVSQVGRETTLANPEWALLPWMIDAPVSEAMTAKRRALWNIQ